MAGKAAHSGFRAPPEIVAQNRAHRRRMLRLYGIGVVGLALVVLTIFLAYDVYQQHLLDVNHHVAAAYSAYSHGDLGTAEQQLRGALSLDDGNYTAHLDLGLVLLKAGRYSDARAELHRAGDINHVATAYLYAGVAALAMRQPQLARGEMAQALAQTPYDDAVNAVAAMADRAAGRAATAARELAVARSYGYTGATLKDYIARAILEGPS